MNDTLTAAETKINRFDIQDLYHRALAMMGEDNGLDAYTLKARLDEAEQVYRTLTTLHTEAEELYWESVMPNPESWRSSEEMVNAGRALKAKCEEWGKLNNIDPNSGEKPQGPQVWDAPETYWHHGTQFKALSVFWIGPPKGFYVRRQSSTGYITGFLTDRGGFGNAIIARVFPSAQAACDAMRGKVRGMFQVVENKGNSKRAAQNQGGAL